MNSSFHHFISQTTCSLEFSEYSSSDSKMLNLFKMSWISSSLVANPCLCTYIMSFPSGLVTLIPFHLVAKLLTEGYQCPSPQHSLQMNFGTSSLSLLVACCRALPLPELRARVTAAGCTPGSSRAS